jgi:hypothetical protein
MSKHANKIVTLKERLKAQKNDFKNGLKSRDLAMRLERKTTNIRLKHLNKVRPQLDQMATTFLTKDNYEAKHDLLQAQVNQLMRSQSNLEGKASQSTVIVSFVIAVGSMLIAAAGVLLHYLK